jgi:chromosomal replication initiation ATPase DnaA
MARSHTNASSNRVGKYFSRDHATVLHGAKKIRRQIWEDWRVAYDIANLEAML